MNLTEEQRKRAEKGLPLPQDQGLGATRKLLADAQASSAGKGSLAGFGAGIKAGFAAPKALAQDLLPNTSAVLSQSAQARKDLATQGRVGALLGEGVRGTAAAVPALLDDTYGAVFRSVAPQAADFGKQLFGVNDEQLAAAPAATEPPKAATSNQPAMGAANVQATPAVAEPSNQAPQTAQASGDMAGAPTNTVTKTVGKGGRVTYSGENITEGFTMQSPKGVQLGMRGGVSTVPGMSQAEIDRTLTNANGTRWSANDNAIMAANIRDGVDPYRGTSAARPTAGQEAIQQMLGAPRALSTLNPKQVARIYELGAGIDNNAATQRNAAARAQLEQAQIQDAMQTNQIKRGAMQMEMDAGKELADLRSRFINETDPAKRAEIAATIRGLSGKGDAPDEWTSTRVSNVNPDGTRSDSVVLTNKRTGETRPANGFGFQSQQAAPINPVALEVGKTYTDANGGKARWDGEKLIPVK